DISRACIASVMDLVDGLSRNVGAYHVCCDFLSMASRDDDNLRRLSEEERNRLSDILKLTIRFAQLSLPPTAARKCVDYLCLDSFECGESEQICGDDLPFSGLTAVFGRSLQLGWHTSSGGVGQWQVVVGTTPPCGDGVRSSDEACDMGILNGRMGCSDECRVLSGWRCDAGGCASVCGDGIRVEGEACDLGVLNGLPSTGCSNNCSVSRGYECSPDNLCQPLCGNGLLDVDEECDDGGQLDGDGCDHDCVVEPWHACFKPENSRGPSFCEYQPVRVHCQNGCSEDWTISIFSWRAVMTAVRATTNTTTFVVHLADTVEDAIVTWSPGVVATCLVLNTTGERFCPGDSPLVISSSVSLRVDKDAHDEFQSGWGFEVAKRECGDGRRHFEEACDDGNSLSGDGCDAACQVEESHVCFGGDYYNGDVCVYQRDDAVTSGCRKIKLPSLSPSLEPCTGLLTVSDHTMTSRKRMVLDFQLPDNGTVAVVDLHHIRPAVMVFDRTTHPEYIALNVSTTPLPVHRRGMVESRRVWNYPEGQLLSNTTVVRDGLKSFPVNLSSMASGTAFALDEGVNQLRVWATGRIKIASTLRLFLYTAICGDGHRTEPFEVCDDANTDSNDGCDYPTCTPSSAISSGTRYGYVCSGGTFTTRDYCSVSFIFIDCSVGCYDFGMESHSGVDAVARLRSGKLTIQVDAEAMVRVLHSVTTAEQQNCTVSADVAGLHPITLPCRPNLTLSSSPPIYLPVGDHVLALEMMPEGLYRVEVSIARCGDGVVEGYGEECDVGRSYSTVSRASILAEKACLSAQCLAAPGYICIGDGCSRGPTRALSVGCRGYHCARHTRAQNVDGGIVAISSGAEFANVTSVLRVATEDITHVLIVEQCNSEEVSLTREGWEAQLCFPQEQALVQWNATGMFYWTPFTPAALLHLLIAPQVCGDGIHVLGEECDGASVGCSPTRCTVEPSHACIGSSYHARRSRCKPINMDGSIYCRHRSCSSLSIEQGPLNGSLLVGRSGSVSAFEKAHIHVKLARGARAVLGWLQPTTGIGWQCGVGRLDLFGDAVSGCRPESSRYLGEIETDEGIERDPLAWRVLDSGKKQDLIIKWSTVGWPYHPGLATNVSWSMMIIGLRCGDGVHLGWLEQCDDGNEDDDDGCDRACNLAPHRAFTDPHKTLPVEGLTITCSGWHCWRFAVLSEGPHRVVMNHQHLEMTSEEADIGLDVANRAILRPASSGRPLCASNEVSLEWTRNSSELSSELCGRDAADDSDLVLNPGSHILRWRTRSAGFSGELGLAISPLVCGDGLRVGPEECDDGNARSKDGCSSTCEVEAGWICRGRARDKRDYCSRLMIPNVAILCTGAACDRLAVDDPWTEPASRRAGPDEGVWIEPGTKLLEPKHEVHVNISNIETLNVLPYASSCRCPGIGRRIGIGEVCSYESCPDQQLSRGQLVCGHGASLDGVMPGCVEKTELLTAKPVPAVLLTLEWIAASDSALRVVAEALDGRLQQLLRASWLRTMVMQPSLFELVYTGTFRSTKALLFSVAIVNANLSLTALDDMSFLTGELARGLGIEADQLVLETLVEKTDTRWWSMPAADNRRGAGLYADDGDEKSALARVEFAVALSGFLVVLACSVAAIRLRLSEDPAESDEDDEEAEEDIAVVVIEGPNEENKTVDGSDDKAEELNGGLQVPMIVIQSSPTSEPARPPQESSDAKRSVSSKLGRWSRSSMIFRFSRKKGNRPALQLDRRPDDDAEQVWAFASVFYCESTCVILQRDITATRRYLDVLGHYYCPVSATA
ncbi:hypothetical protein FOZ62_014810, partial [Perkinsus olseni]